MGLNKFSCFLEMFKWNVPIYWKKWLFWWNSCSTLIETKFWHSSLVLSTGGTEWSLWLEAKQQQKKFQVANPCNKLLSESRRTAACTLCSSKWLKNMGRPSARGWFKQLIERNSICLNWKLSFCKEIGIICCVCQSLFFVWLLWAVGIVITL